MPSHIVVYTALFGGRDILRAPAVVNGQVSYVCFTDASLDMPPWRFVKCPKYQSRECTLQARKRKVLSHRFFPDAEYSIWMDASLSLQVDPVSLVETFLRERDIATFAHAYHRNVSQEIEECIAWRKDTRAMLLRQRKRYVSLGCHLEPVISSGLLLRRHSPAIRGLNECWWAEIAEYSTRDQVSFPYCSKQLQVPYAIIPGSYYANPWCTYHGHHTSFVRRAGGEMRACCRRMSRVLLRKLRKS